MRIVFDVQVGLATEGDCNVCIHEHVCERKKKMEMLPATIFMFDCKHYINEEDSHEDPTSEGDE